MKLRTTKKQKSNDYDLGCESEQDQSHKKTNTNKSQNEKEVHSSNDNSNISNENECKNKHKLRNSSSNYQGKYKKMNSGKYLYKPTFVEKRPPIVKKKQLRFIPNDLISQFKKFLTHLYKKDEENILNKKKKREEGKQKNKSDKSRFQNRPLQQNYQNINMPIMPYQHMEIFNGYYQKGYLPPGYQYPGQQVMFLINNRDYPNFPNGYPFAPVEQQKEVINSVYIDNLLKKGVVNHIVGAFYILHSQQAKSKSIIEHKKIVPISTVNLDGDENDQQMNSLLGPGGNNFNDPPIQRMMNQEHQQNMNQGNYNQNVNPTQTQTQNLQNPNPNTNPSTNTTTTVNQQNQPQNSSFISNNSAISNSNEKKQFFTSNSMNNNSTNQGNQNCNNVLCPSNTQQQGNNGGSVNQMANFGVNPNISNMTNILTEPYNLNVSSQNQLNTVDTVLKSLKEQKDKTS